MKKSETLPAKEASIATVRPRRVVVFTDLDGTLLDHDTYSWEAARPALELVRRCHVPLIFNTSKTRAELGDLRGQMDIRDPFVVENGGAIYYPRGYFKKGIGWPPLADSEHFVEELLGPGYAQIRRFIERMRRDHGYRLAGFGDLTDEEVARHTGLSPAQAALARQRQCSEPFLWQDSAQRFEAFKRKAEQAGFRILKGGRFYHLIGHSDKGKALRQLMAKYRSTWPNARFLSLALGDSPNDLDMLQAADLPILVQRPGGQYAAHPPIKNLYLARGIGPRGWNEAMLHWLPQLLA